MKIGLVRHFKVKFQNFVPVYTPNEFRKAMNEYDNADIIPNEIYLDGSEWQMCFCSSLKRATETAQLIYKNEIVKTDLLIEVSLSPFTNKEIKLP